MRSPISAPTTHVFVFAITMSLGMTMALLALFYMLVFAPAQPTPYGVPQAAVHVVAPALAPAAAIADDTSALHFESAAHTTGVYDVLPAGSAAHDPESAAATTGTLMYRER